MPLPPTDEDLLGSFADEEPRFLVCNETGLVVNIEI